MHLLLIAAVALSLNGQGMGMGGQNQGGGGQTPQNVSDLATILDIPGIDGVNEGGINGNGNMNGEGLLDYDWCYLSGDPHVCNYRQECALLRLPCRLHMTTLLVKETQGVFVRLDAFVTGGEPLDGRYFVECLEVLVQILDGNGPGNLTPRPGGSGNFTVCSDDVDTARQNDDDDAWNASNGDLGGEVQTAYDKGNNLALLTFPFNSVIFTFRPVNRLEGFMQSKRPGVASLVSQDLFPDQDSRFPKTLCSNRNDNRKFSVLRKQMFFQVANENQMMVHAVLGQDIDQPVQECRDAADTFQDDCGSDNSRKGQALRTCHFLTSSRYVRCQVNQGDLFGLGFFRDCMRAVCQDNPAKDVNTVLADAEAACP